jgi:hypothetical protein
LFHLLDTGSPIVAGARMKKFVADRSKNILFLPLLQQFAKPCRQATVGSRATRDITADNRVLVLRNGVALLSVIRGSVFIHSTKAFALAAFRKIV